MPFVGEVSEVGVSASLTVLVTVDELDDDVVLSSVLDCARVVIVDKSDSLEIMPLVELSRKVLACVVVTSTLSNVDVNDAIFVVGIVNWFALVVELSIVVLFDGVSVFLVRLSQFITVICTVQLYLHFSLTPLIMPSDPLSTESGSESVSESKRSPKM